MDDLIKMYQSHNELYEQIQWDEYEKINKAGINVFDLILPAIQAEKNSQ